MTAVRETGQDRTGQATSKQASGKLGYGQLLEVGAALTPKLGLSWLLLK